MIKTITCRYGVKYTVKTMGNRGAQRKLWDLLGRCCCWVCHNRHCEEPKDEILPDCKEICTAFYTKTPYCKK